MRKNNIKYLNKDKDRVMQSYECKWCGHNFKLVVGIGFSPGNKRLSTQIKCPKCGNGLPTW